MSGASSYAEGWFLLAKTAIAGGDGGAGYSGANGGAGAQAVASNAVFASSVGGSFDLIESASGGSGGSSKGGVAGAAGAGKANLIFDDTKNPHQAILISTILTGQGRATRVRVRWRERGGRRPGQVGRRPHRR